MDLTRMPKKPSKRLLAAKKEHYRFLAAMGVARMPAKRQNNPDNFPDLTVPSRGAKLSNSIPGNGFKKSVDDYRWKRDREEKHSAILEAERKKSRVAPAYNKGPLMYVTEADDPKSLGRKL
jgi:hypothetical protein